jgi:type VI secretion system protein
MPYLKLKIVSGSEIGQNDNCSFTNIGGSIGRSKDCDWTLIDSDRFVSKKHLVISYKNQQFILTDVSSNGVIINSAGDPLGRDNEHIIQATDTLVIGKHVVQVEDINVDSEDVNPFQTQHDDGGLLGLVMGTDEATESIQESVQGPQDFFKIPENQNPFLDNKPESELGLGDILSSPIKSPAESEFLNFNDQSNPFDISTPSTPSFNVTSDNDSIITSHKSDNSLIPDDWEMSDTIFSAENVAAPIESEITASLSVTVDSFDTSHHDNVFAPSEINKSVPELFPENTSPILNEEPLLVVEDTKQETNSTQSLVQSTHPEASPKNSNNTRQSDSTEEVSNITNDDFFTTLYEKLGLSKEFKATINREAFAEDIATILLSTTQGLMSLLASRTAFKQESRLSSTLIQPRSNNPIKFSIDPVDTLEMLLVKKKKGYMTVGNSYDEAMEDIQLHQMAFMSGLQGTLDGVLAQLDPEEIEKQVRKKSQRFMALNANSQCWQIYKEKQPLLAKSVKENLNEVLGTYFSDAYQSQINSFKNDK